MLKRTFEGRVIQKKKKKKTVEENVGEEEVVRSANPILKNIQTRF